MRRRRLFPAGLLLVLAPLPLPAESPSAVSPRHWPGDAGKVIVSPLHWDGRDLGRFGLVAAGAGLSLLLDDSVQERAGRTHRGKLHGLSENVRYLGEGPVLVPAMGAAWLYGELAGKTRLKEAALVGLESWLVSGAIVGAAKISVRRDRPGSDEGGFSFPSGHSAAAFSTARAAAWYFKDSPAAPYACYGLAALVAWSRVNDNDHWTSDAVAGSALGYFTADKLVKLNEARGAGAASLLPFYGGGPGLAAVYRF